MRRFVNGDETLLSTDQEAWQEGDLIWIETTGGPRSALVVEVGERLLVSFRGRQYAVDRRDRNMAAHSGSHSGEITAPMPGQIVDVKVKAGEWIEAGATLLVLEAMKTQQPLLAPFFGRVSQVLAEIGHQVREGDLLAIMRQEPRPSE